MRPPWSTYFLELAKVVATRATCTRLQVGCVLVRGNRVLATGYNGSPPGAAHCVDVGCVEESGHCVATVHSEANAIAQAAKHGIGIDGATAYVTHQPCRTCSKLLSSAGVDDVVFLEAYP